MGVRVSHNVLLWLVAIAVFMETLDSTIINTALPTIANALGENPLHMYAIVIAYSLALAVLIPASGWMADRFGTRIMFMSAILLFTTGSIACAASTNLTYLVLSRVLQGVGGSMMLPVGRLAVLRAFPNEKYLNAISFVAIPGLVGPLIGPTLGGWIVQTVSWHWIFLVNVPVGILGVIATLIYMPDFRGPEKRSFDFNGFAMLSFSMLTMSVGLDGLSELGLAQATVLVLVITSLAALAAYWLHASRNTKALFPLQLFETTTYRIGLIGNMFSRIGSGSMPFLIPLYLQLHLGYAPAKAGMMMLPIAIASILSKRTVQPLVQRFSYKRVLMVNTLLVGASIASFSMMKIDQPGWITIIQLSFLGFVNSVQYTAMNSLTLKDLTATHASSGNSLYSMVQMFAMSLGTAAAGALLATFSPGGVGNASQTAQAFSKTFIVMGLITCTSTWIFAQLSSSIKRMVSTP